MSLPEFELQLLSAANSEPEECQGQVPEVRANDKHVRR
jgi:hypothetical protein